MRRPRTRLACLLALTLSGCATRTRPDATAPDAAAGADRSNFVWTVAKGHQQNEADRAIMTRAAEILAAYTTRRARYIGAGKPGAFALLRDWYCGGRGGCRSPIVFN